MHSGAMFLAAPGRSFAALFTRATVLLMLLSLVSCSGKKEIRSEGPFDPEQTLNRGTELIEKKDYEDARRALLEVKNRDLTKKYAPLAQLKIADSYAKEEEYDLAVEEYRRFLELYPEHSNAPYAQYQIAMTYFGQIGGQDKGYGAAAKALQEFEKLKRMFPRNPYREVIELRIEQCRNAMANYEFLVGEFYFKKGSYTAALGRFNTLTTKYPEYKQMPMVYYLMALSYKNLGNKEKAMEYLKTILDTYPDDRIAKDAQKEYAALAR